MPEAFARPEWDDVRIMRWASDVGPGCEAVVSRIFERARLKEQAYNPALSVLNLSKKYGRDRLEAACGHALPGLSSPRYRHLKAILESRLDEGRAPSGRRPSDGGPHGHLRGADYYRD